MHDERQDKKPLHGNDLQVPLPDEILLPENPEENKEQDLDDLVHSISLKAVADDEEIDADDAVHRPTTNSSFQPDTEKDPDDLVHGN